MGREGIESQRYGKGLKIENPGVIVPVSILVLTPSLCYSIKKWVHFNVRKKRNNGSNHLQNIMKRNICYRARRLHISMSGQAVMNTHADER